MEEQEVVDKGDGEDNSELPKAWVEAFLQYEEHITSVLDEAKREKLNDNHDKSRELLLNLGSNLPEAFRAVIYSVNLNEDFLDDVEEQMDSETREGLESLNSEYSILQDESLIVRYLVGSPRENVPTRGTLSIDFKYSENMPFIDYTLQSGDVELLDIQAEPSVFIHLSHLALDAAVTALEDAAEYNHQIDEEEMAEVVSTYQSLQSEMEEANELIENITSEMDLEPEDAESETTEGDPENPESEQ
ncbi:hypothetical protein GOC83_08185 [Haloarcula rubripromontorii]|uniref:Uncharacterized protein n=1 Tax=Haloarcula rubripromontorii TaxID=1705562 RepID=A0A847TYG9_9EURY|nr:hypothetical protein [Haloarcula rubripromontorii]NLV06105.1 hypothetical protein [Haloarcula rubripromontorii]